MKIWMKRILDFFFPPKCVLCGALLQREEEHFCRKCREHFPWNNHTCPIPGSEPCRAPLCYEGAVRKAVRRLKFQGRSFYAPAFAELMAPCVNELRPDFITWVPVSRKRLRERGYDQARLLAEETAGLLALPCVSTLEKRHTGRQSEQPGRSARFDNVKGAFSVPDPERVRGKSILLIDDICTTGATLSECVRVLREAGAAELFCLTLAMTEERNSR